MARNGRADPPLYLNRHYSRLQFNERVPEEACDPANPPLERVEFLGITASNLDEFAEVRVAGMLQQLEHGNHEARWRTPGEVLKELTARIHRVAGSQTIAGGRGSCRRSRRNRFGRPRHSGAAAN